MTGNPTADLAEFGAGIFPTSIPDAVKQRVLQLAIDAVGCAIVGRGGSELERFQSLGLSLGGEGDATVVGSSKRLAPIGATIVNSYQITAMNLCDLYRPAHCHLSPIVVPPALVIAERDDSSGAELISALTAGFETACRVGLGLNFETFRARGWHSAGVLGPFGAAASAGRMMGLDPDAMLNALSLAGSQSAGTVVQWGTPTIKFHQVRASVAGLTAAMLAGEGFEAADNVLTAPEGGILNNFTDGGSPDAVTADLGGRWELERISLKRWPSGSGVQTTVTSLIDLIRQHGLTPDAVLRMRLTLPSHAYEFHANLAWDDKFSAMLSARYVAAVVMFDGRCWIDQFEDERRSDPAVDEFARRRVEIVEDSSLAPGAALTEIHTTDGAIFRDERSVTKGDPEDPYPLEEIVQKFRDASGGLLDSKMSDQVLEQVLHLEELDSVRPLVRSLGFDHQSHV